MNYLTYSGNNIVNARLPDGARVFHAPDALPGIGRAEIPTAVRRAFENPLGMSALKDLVGGSSKILVAFDDNCQPFPETTRPDIRQQSIETLLDMLLGYGVKRENIDLICAIALHRKMKKHELARMLGPRIMAEFYPGRLINFDAEDREYITDLGETGEGEPVQIYKGVVESDLVIYIDSVQIPLNGGHKSVAVGLGTYDSIANHHHPKMTEETPHVMQPDGSQMHACIERISRVIQKNSRIMVMEAAMNNATYPRSVRHLGLPDDQCGGFQKLMKRVTPLAMKLMPEPLRRSVLRGVRGAYKPVEINAGDIDAVHARTIDVMTKQMSVPVADQFDTLVFGLPDLSPYAVDARINPVLVVSDVLGYIFNWFYHKPLIRKGGAVIILNPCFEVFHPEYHVAYRKFYEEVLPDTPDPFEMKERYQEKFARDPYLIDCYRHRFAHHGFHPFTVWYWATYAFKYLSKVILVGPRDAAVAKQLGVSWSPNVDHALAACQEASGGDRVAALTIPPFFYTKVG